MPEDSLHVLFGLLCFPLRHLEILVLSPIPAIGLGLSVHVADGLLLEQGTRPCTRVEVSAKSLERDQFLLIVLLDFLLSCFGHALVVAGLELRFDLREIAQIDIDGLSADHVSRVQMQKAQVRLLFGRGDLGHHSSRCDLPAG